MVEMGAFFEIDDEVDWNLEMAVQLGFPPESGIMEMQHAYNEIMKNGTVHPPTIVENKDAPLQGEHLDGRRG